ncbi:MAG: flippase-like domain-containing protein [Dehalococcoidia bacterium]|nr:flippase-like domain-containing protein [Dehalococcoidia bacterium]
MSNSGDASKPPASSLGKRLLSLPALASFAIAGVFLYFLFTRFDIDLGDTWAQVRGNNWWMYLLALVVYYASFPIRGWRWRIIAANAVVVSPPEKRLPSVWRCGCFILQGWFINTISWFRLGDAYRAYAFSEATGASFPRVFGTVVAERVMDGVVVAVLLLLAAGLLAVTGGLLPSPLIFGAALAVMAAGVALLLLMKHLGLRLARWLPRRLAEAYARLHEGTMGSFRNLPAIALLSLGAWLLEAGRLLLVLQALGLSLHLSLVLFVALASALLTTVPITPGGLGVVELGATGLLMLELTRDAAVSAVLLDRSISYLSIVVVGAGFFLVQQVRARPGPLGRRQKPMQQ